MAARSSSFRNSTTTEISKRKEGVSSNTPQAESRSRSPTPQRHNLPPLRMRLPSTTSSSFHVTAPTTTTHHPSNNVSSSPSSRPAAPSSSSVVCPVKLRMRRSLPLNASPFDSSQFMPMLPAVDNHHQDRMTLALDIDETLVHAKATPAAHVKDWHPCRRASWFSEMRDKSDMQLHLHVGMPNEEYIHVRFRPGVHEFIAFAAERFEVVVFTASLKAYADPVMDALDPRHMLRRDLRLYREHCADVAGAKVKDLSLLGRQLHRVALIDNLTSSFMFQPRNGIHISSWYGDPKDTELYQLMDVLRELSTAPSAHDVLDAFHSSRTVFCKK